MLTIPRCWQSCIARLPKNQQKKALVELCNNLTSSTHAEHYQLMSGAIDANRQEAARSNKTKDQAAAGEMGKGLCE